MNRLAAAALALLFGIGAVTTAAAEKPGLAVKLRPAARAEGRFLKLVEIAELSGPRAAEAARVLLGRVPEIGARVTLARGEVQLRLEEEGFDRRNFSVAGAEKVTVRSAAEKLSARGLGNPRHSGRAAPSTPAAELQGKFAGWIRASLAERLSCKPEKLEIRVSRLRGSLPDGKLTPRVEWRAGGLRLGRQRVRVSLLREGKPVGRLEGYIEAVARLKVLVATRNIQKDEMLLPGDLKPTELLLTDLGGKYFPDAKGLLGMCAARPIKAGEALRPKMLKKQKMVRRGQPVTVVAEAGAVRITERAIAKSDGGLGDLIVVERAGKRPPLTVRVTGNGIVKVD